MNRTITKKRSCIAKALLVALMYAVTITSTGCGSLYENTGKKDYTTVENVTGIKFDVPTPFVNEATAISMISETETYDGLCVYQTSNENYILFNIESVVISCAKTNFGFKGKEKEETLEKKSVNGVWMKTEKFSSSHSEKDGIYKIYSQVDASYSVTPKQYCDMKGYMASVTNGKNEYTIFAGAVTSELTKDQKETLGHIVKSLAFTEEGNAMESKKVEETDEKNPAADTKTGAKTEKAEGKSEPKADDTEVTISVEEKPTESTEETEVKEEKPFTKEKEETKKESNDTKSATTKKDEANDNTKTDATKNVTNDTNEDGLIPMTEAIKEIFQPKSSSVYTPLSQGEWGTTTGMYDNVYGYMDVRLDNIYRGDDAKALVSELDGRKATPTEGTSFEVAEFTTDVSRANAYLDVRFCGVDGTRLKLRGISYTTRTYDLDTETSGMEVGIPVYTKQYVYYEVPTGCKEYMLDFGGHITADVKLASKLKENQAYFLVKAEN